MIAQANAKLNLTLFVTGRDPKDGYHRLSALFQEIDWADEVEVRPAEKDLIEFEGIELSSESTVHRALRLFKKESGTDRNFHIRVKKEIPIGAGLGGGSSDAAAVLKLLNTFHPIPSRKILEIARQVGSDVPFFLKGGLALVEGKGEKVKHLDLFLSRIWFLVIYPDLFISTAEAYSWIESYDSSPDLKILEKKQALSVDFLEKIMYNTFQKFVMRRVPDLERFYSKLRKLFPARPSMMSGSGSSLFFVYDRYEEALKDLETLRSTEDVPCRLCEPVYPEAAKGNICRNG